MPPSFTPTTDAPPVARTAVALALGASALLASATAHAAIVHRTVNLTVPATTAGLYINVVTGASGSAIGTPGWDINPWGSSGLGFFSPSGPIGGAYALASAATVANLAPGATIGPDAVFGSGVSSNFSQWNLDSSERVNEPRP
jgi:hypothetical protein